MTKWPLIFRDFPERNGGNAVTLTLAAVFFGFLAMMALTGCDMIAGAMLRADMDWRMISESARVRAANARAGDCWQQCATEPECRKCWK